VKKFLKTVLIFIAIICLICLTQKLGILDFFALDVNEEKIASYSEYYFDKLDQDEKEMYIRIDEAVKNIKNTVFLGTYNSSDLTDKVERVVNAYFYDNPECYYLSNEYLISIKDFKIFKYLMVKLNYITEDKDELTLGITRFETEIEKFLIENIEDDMTDFEKEVAIHDALIKQVDYYEYEDINNIPDIKHTAYGALIENEAVCDGYSKAFKLLLKKVGIDSIIISGNVDGVPHAWNIVKLDDEYYHVDVTTDKMENKTSKYAIHKYFNITDKEILNSHVFDKMFEYPKCIYNYYDYYIQTGYYIDDVKDIDNKLENIISEQKFSKILEIKIEDEYYVRKVIDALYELNFNNWRSDGKTNVSYSQVKDIYIFFK